MLSSRHVGRFERQHLLQRLDRVVVARKTRVEDLGQLEELRNLDAAVLFEPHLHLEQIGERLIARGLLVEPSERLFRRDVAWHQRDRFLEHRDGVFGAAQAILEHRAELEEDRYSVARKRRDLRFAAEHLDHFVVALVLLVQPLDLAKDPEVLGREFERFQQQEERAVGLMESLVLDSSRAEQHLRALDRILRRLRRQGQDSDVIVPALRLLRQSPERRQRERARPIELEDLGVVRDRGPMVLEPVVGELGRGQKERQAALRLHRDLERALEDREQRLVLTAERVKALEGAYRERLGRPCVERVLVGLLGFVRVPELLLEDGAFFGEQRRSALGPIGRLDLGLEDLDDHPPVPDLGEQAARRVQHRRIARVEPEGVLIGHRRVPRPGEVLFPDPTDLDVKRCRLWIVAERLSLALVVGDDRLPARDLVRGRRLGLESGPVRGRRENG